MTTAVTPLPAASRPGPLRRAVSDAATLALRVLLYYRHSPGLILASLTVPAVMVVVFGYVFGSAMRLPGGGDYREFLVPGLFAMVAVNGIMPTMIGAARDVGRGVTDRLRSLSVSRPAVLLGQVLADLVVGVVVLAVLAAIGLAVGWRIRGGPADALTAFALLVLFRFTMTWMGIYLGLAVAKEDVAAQVGILVLPVAMITNAFVPTGGMPGWLRTIAEWNPMSAVVTACRDLFGNPGALAADAPWPLEHPVAATLGWSALLLLVFVPLAVRQFSRHGR